MRFQALLIATGLAIFSPLPSAQAGGSVSWDAVQVLLAQRPELRDHLLETLDVEEVGGATRLGKIFPYLSGMRAAPYVFGAKAAGSEGDYNLTLTIEANMIFLDEEGNLMDGEVEEAVELKEELTGFRLEPYIIPLSVEELSEAEEEARDNDIHKWYGLIQDQKQELRKVEFQSEYDPLGGIVTWYSLPGSEEVCLVEAEVGFGDHGGGTESYYFHEGEFFLANMDDGYWTFDPEREGKTIDYLTRERFYFMDGKLYFAMEKSASGPTEELDDIFDEAEFSRMPLNGTEDSSLRGKAYFLLDAAPEDVIRAWEIE